MGKFKSRKFWLTIAGVAVTVCNEIFDMGLDREAVLTIVGSIAAYVLGQGIVDAKKAEAGEWD